MMLLLALLISSVAWADNVTEEQALKQAKAFLASHRPTSNSGGKKMSSNAALKLQGKVSGLYVFNAIDGSGFVIVSNDDQTTPILGFGDNGSIDTENMPANMRAWLQGYADEIAWLQKKQPTKSAKTVQKAPNRAQSRAPLSTHATKTIGPLVETKWNQRTPYT